MLSTSSIIFFLVVVICLLTLVFLKLPGLIIFTWRSALLIRILLPPLKIRFQVEIVVILVRLLLSIEVVVVAVILARGGIVFKWFLIFIFVTFWLFFLFLQILSDFFFGFTDLLTLLKSLFYDFFIRLLLFLIRLLCCLVGLRHSILAVFGFSQLLGLLFLFWHCSDLVNC